MERMVNKYQSHSEEAQLQRRIEKQCLHKVAFQSEEAALKNKGQRAYLCPVCKMWHRTSAIPRWVKNRNKKEESDA